ncbi:uncharacterized protein [Henckelia pumila]|uniref:uncharacterized protein n=1 Tax=Henckelia pumila TaxID=405737 RepID=UPI003C6E332C
MDKKWIHLPSRLVPEYEEGVQKFIAQARNYAKTREVILFPCKRCKNKKYMKFDDVYDHLIIKGFNPSYTVWVFHGEIYNSKSQGEGSSGGVRIEDESREAYNLYKNVFVPEEEDGNTMPETKDYMFADLLEDAETPLFPGCTTYTKLSAVVTLYNYKSTNGHSDNSFNELLKILVVMLPEKNILPENVYSMRKLLKPFDLGYEKIHACPNDCCSFRNELKDLELCPKCGSSRWKVDKVTAKVCKGVPEKKLWDTGVESYDAFNKSMFNMKAIFMWTINDFPDYGNLAGCSTKGKLGCPICGENVCSMWLKYSRKFSYMGHRRFLAPNHPFRQKKKWFNGKKETKGKPRPLNGLEIMDEMKDIENDWG